MCAVARACGESSCRVWGVVDGVSGYPGIVAGNRRNHILEQMVARATATGVCGVLVHEYSDGGWRAWVTTSAPFGEVKVIRKDKRP